ncbi:MAG: hypothetical protein II711_01560, partial [Clostridia bacterium]|nr:hypothetical protein [Clostridia bacterium]
KDYQFFTELGVSGKTDITSPDDPDLIPVKTALNHGEILAFTSHSPANSWQYLTLTAASDAEINKGCIGQYTMKSADYNKGGHRMTIVGYNDNIWTDINGNHQIDAGEMGAFKIANSWGKSYRNGGFSWVAYDALNAKSSVAGVTNASERQRAIRYIGRLEVADYDNSPQFLLKATVNTSNRYRTKLTVIQKKDGKENKMVIYPIATLYSGTSYDPLTFDGLTIDAGQTAKDATVVVDLKALDPELTRANLSSYEWYLECDDNLADGRPFTVKNVEIDDEATGYAYQAKTTPLTLENKKETVAIECQSEGAMVYYRGYNNPVIRYQVEGSSDWVNVSGEKMVYDLTQYGYDHFYLINLGMAESALVDFGDGKGAWDTNNGSHYVVKKGNNFFVTPDVGEPLVLNIKNSFGTLCDIGCTDSIYPETTGGYAPYTIKMVMKNLSTGKMVKEETFTVSDHKAEGFLYQYTEQGTYQAEITVTDAAKSAVKKSVNVKVEDMPFKITGFGITDVQLDYAPGDTIELTAKTANDSIDKNSIITFSAVKDNLVYSKQELSVADEANIRQKSSLTKWSWTPSEPGKYILTVHRADADGNYASRSMTLTVSSYHPVTFRSLTVNPSANIAMGENVKVTANASSDS